MMSHNLILCRQLHLYAFKLYLMLLLMTIKTILASIQQNNNDEFNLISIHPHQGCYGCFNNVLTKVIF